MTYRRTAQIILGTIASLVLTACIRTVVYPTAKVQTGVYDIDGHAYFTGCYEGLMRAATLSGVSTSFEAYQAYVVQTCNEAYTTRYPDQLQLGYKVSPGHGGGDW